MTVALPPLVLFCDFGLPYTGQMKAAIWLEAPGVGVIDLMHDAPTYDPVAASVLLAAFADDFPPASVFVCVVDPGVGSAARSPGAVKAGGRWFVGPLNGLFEHVLRRWPDEAEAFEITWKPDDLSATFHGRDLFAPIAARLALGDESGLKRIGLDQVLHPDMDDDPAEIIYIDDFGNCVTGIRASSVAATAALEVDGQILTRVRTFADVAPGQAFVYENANGLLEIAVNLGNARKKLDLIPGSQVHVSTL